MPSIRRVSSQVDPNDAAKWIVSSIEKCGVLELQAVGDNAISRAVKAVAIAKKQIAQIGMWFVPLPLWLQT